jgi:hypothetical protein
MCEGFASPTSGFLFNAGITPPRVLSSNVVKIADGNQSTRPCSVAYAITYVRQIPTPYFDIGITNQESAPISLGGIGGNGTLWYEGDYTKIQFTLVTPPVNDQIGTIRLYRSITAIESAEQIVNTFDTDYYLVAEIGNFNYGIPITYYDSALTQDTIASKLLTKNNQCPYFIDGGGIKNVGLTESGWVWATTEYEVLFSDRFSVHNWPIANYLTIDYTSTIQHAVSFYDYVFLGTQGKPYKISIKTSGDLIPNIEVTPYPEYQPCINRTMVTCPFGALYTSPNGIVALEPERMSVITKDLLNAGDYLYQWCDNGALKKFYFSDITTAAWFNGWYIGFAPYGKIFVYQVPEDLNDAHPFQQLVTMDAPQPTAPVGAVVSNYGLHTCFSNKMYYWPVPGWQRPGDKIQKLCYQWKSKKFVFPGQTTFSAAKVVAECDGDVCFKLYGDGQLVCTRKITDNNPFRLPMHTRHVEWEIELIGTATVSEVHVATSMNDLVEVENG